MPTFRIKQGAHYHGMPPISTLPWIGAQRMERRVTFSPECAYDSAAYNADDVNKLFGLSFGFGGVHHNSARFGWRWSKADQCIELLAYIYCEGKRNQDNQLRFPVVAQVKPGQQVYCIIEATTDLNGKPAYFFQALFPDNPKGWVVTSVPRPKSLPHFGLTHGLYFGGVLMAPHEMSVQIDRP